MRDNQLYNKSSSNNPRSSISVVHVMGTIVMLVCVCVGIIGGGLFGCLVGIIAGLASASGFWVFAGMAEDLQSLRHTVEVLSRTVSRMEMKEKNS